MNIIIPVGGKGERFQNEGYLKPKPLINIFNKEMIFHVLDNLFLFNTDKIFIIYHTDLDKSDFSKIIKTKYPYISFIPISYQTSGAIETIYNGLSTIKEQSNNKKSILLDCDTFYTYDILSIARETNKNMVFYTSTQNDKPIYSYIKLDENKKIIEIKEKEKISSYANTGAYLFNDINVLETYSKFILDNKITYNGEPYTSCVISEMIKSTDFYGYELQQENVFSLGTPQDVNNFIDKTYVFLFDLDGTLVNTDDIYFNVWKDLLYNYNIDLTKDIFYRYIHGNSDEMVIKKLLPNTDIKHISDLKDSLFIKKINEIKIIDGMFEFIKSLKEKGYFSSIVTNCNREVAEKIIEYCNITKLIDYIVIGNECKRPKPYPDPYLQAMSNYNIKSNKTIIFEDSKSGLLSGRLANPLCLVGITTNYNEEQLLVSGANIIISNFINIDIKKLIYYNDLTIPNVKKYIINSLQFDIIDIVIDDNKLKGGFISDVLSLKIVTTDNILNCVLKLENRNKTKLSIMAEELGLYERENYFYDKISNNININYPKFYGLIKDDNFNNIGILMENLKVKQYALNLNLNLEKIEVSLNVIENMAKMHSKFWNKNLKKIYPELKKHNDPFFNPKWKNFIGENWEIFKGNWKNILTNNQMQLAEYIYNNFNEIQERLSCDNLTIIHGDIKSPNIFYDTKNNYEPYFLDWQYIANGKGVQDLIFFLIESYDLDNIKLFYPIFKNYYYVKILEKGIQYSYTDYEQDLKDAVCYFPYFVSIWFGTTPQDELIDKNFPFFFIQKVFYLIEFILDNKVI